MKELVRCKACGYVMEKSALGEVCPACGVKAQMFEPFEEKVTGLRHLLLELDIHPITVHLPETLAALLLLFTLVFPLIPANLQAQFLWPTAQILSWLFPLSVAAGFVTGLWDAKVRYRKVTTPILVRKIGLGVLLFLTSIAQAVLVSVGPGFQSFGLWLGYLIVSAISLGLGSILGKIGVKLIHGAMPGDKIFLGKKKKKQPAKPAAPTPPQA